MDIAQPLGVPGLEDAVPVPQVTLRPGLHSGLLHHGIVVAVDLIPPGDGFPPAEGELAVRDAQQGSNILLPGLAEGQQLEVGVGLFAGLHALGPPDFQLVEDGGHRPLAPAGHIGHAEHDGLGGKALLHVEIDQLFHLAVGQRAGKAGLSAVDEARDHGVGAACGGDLRPGHGGRSRGLCSRRGVLVVALEKPRTGPEGEGAFGRDAAAQFKVGTNFFGVGDAGGQHIQRYPDIVFLGDAQLGKDELRHRDGVALELFETVYHLLSPLSASSSFGGGDQGSQSRMEGRCFQSARSAL